MVFGQLQAMCAHAVTLRLVGPYVLVLLHKENRWEHLRGWGDFDLPVVASAIERSEASAAVAVAVAAAATAAAAAAAAASAAAAVAAARQKAAPAHIVDTTLLQSAAQQLQVRLSRLRQDDVDSEWGYFFGIS
jgi:hypothetical protein